MFSRFFQRKTKIQIPVNVPEETDPSFGNSVAAKAATLLEQGNYDLLVQLYDLASGNDKSMILNKCCLTDQYETAIENWSLKSNSHFHSNLFHGVFLTYAAWQARSGAAYVDISEDQYKAFSEYLSEAHELLYECHELKQGQAEVYSRLIRICMGLSDAESAENYFDMLLDVDAGHIGGHMFMYNLYTPKWLGSDETIDDFNNMAVVKTEQYPLLVIVQLMHMAERYNIWYWDDADKASENATQQFPAQVVHWYNWFGKQQNLHLGYTNLILNYFAFLFHICGMEQDRNQVINKLDVNIPAYPWSYIGITSNSDFWSKKW